MGIQEDNKRRDLIFKIYEGLQDLANDKLITVLKAVEACNTVQKLSVPSDDRNTTGDILS